jgi:hypothetical protein
MSVSYELLFLHSIPFLARVGDTDKTRKLYYYDAKHIGDGTEPIAIGTYDNGAIKLDEDWQLRLQPRVDAWKGTLTSSERGIIQPRAPKPSKPKRTSPKATTAGTTSTAATGTETTATTATSNIIVHPETGSNPPSTKGRRRGVRTNAKAAL